MRLKILTLFGIALRQYTFISTLSKQCGGTRKASTATRFTVSLTLTLLHSRFNTPFFMLTVHRSTHLQICFRQKIVHAFFFPRTLVTCITNRGLLYFAVVTQDPVIFMDIPLISSLCNSPNSLLKSSFINMKSKFIITIRL